MGFDYNVAVQVAVDGWYGNLSERWFEVEKRGRRARHGAPTDGGKAITKTPGNILKKQKTAERIERINLRSYFHG